jgi:hypothetical protein
VTAATLVLELIFEADLPPEIHAYCQDPLRIAVKSSLHSTISSAMMIDDLGSTRGGCDAGGGNKRRPTISHSRIDTA